MNFPVNKQKLCLQSALLLQMIKIFLKILQKSTFIFTFTRHLLSLFVSWYITTTTTSKRVHKTFEFVHGDAFSLAATVAFRKGVNDDFPNRYGILGHLETSVFLVIPLFQRMLQR